MARWVLTTLLLLLAAPDLVAQQAPVDDSAAEHRIRPGDVVRLRIWREEDLSGDIPVAEDGFAVFPRIGRVRVAGRTGDELQASLAAEFGRFLRDRDVEVVVLRRVLILGAVGTPGLYNLPATTSVADALATASGVSPLGRRDRVEILRDGKLIELDFAADRSLADMPVHSGDQIFVPPLPRVRVLGAVRMPGLYPLEPGMTIADALAAAGGVSGIGVRDRVEIVRDGKRSDLELSDAMPAADVPARPGDQYYIPERNWFVRNYGIVITAATTAAGIITAWMIADSGSN